MPAVVFRWGGEYLEYLAAIRITDSPDTPSCGFDMSGPPSQGPADTRATYGECPTDRDSSTSRVLQVGDGKSRSCGEEAAFIHPVEVYAPLQSLLVVNRIVNALGLCASVIARHRAVANVP